MMELLVTADRASARLETLLHLARTFPRVFPKDHLREQNMMVWAEQDRVGFWLVFDQWPDVDRDRIRTLASEYNLEVTEVTALPEAERRTLREAYLFGTDYRFRSPENARTAFAFFARRLKEVHRARAAQ